MLTLFDQPKTLTKSEQYDSDNPQIWVEFKNIAIELILKGREHYGAKSIFEVIRYHTAVKGKGEFEVNNNYTAYYARKFMREYPEYDGFFETREKK